MVVLSVTNKTPFLDGFPINLFGRAKTSGQDLLRKTRQILATHCPGGFCAILCELIPHQLIASGSGTRRRRQFSGEVTFWAFLFQTLSIDGSCARAVVEVQSWMKQEGRPVPSADSSSYCKARQRLPIELLHSVRKHLVTSLRGSTPTTMLWLGHIAKAIDGCSVQLPDTPKNQHEYPQSSSQQAGCGFPVLQFGALVNLCNGAWEQYVTSVMSRHDHKLLHELLPHICKDEVLVADRAFASFEMFTRVAELGAWMVARTHQMRKIDWSKGLKIGPDERIVTWHKPKRPSGSCLSTEQWDALPTTLQVRLIRVRTTDREGKAKTIFLTTTLLDAKRYTVDAVAQLYCKRWQIELRFRDLKTTMGMEWLRTKTPDMAHKELAMHCVAYNLLRLLILRAGLAKGIDPSRISFKGAIQVLATCGAGAAGLGNKPRRRSELLSGLIEQIAQREVPDRPDRWEPRVVKRRPKRYDRMTQPRSKHHNDYEQEVTQSTVELAS